MPKFRVTLARTRAVRKDGTPMTPTQIMAIRDVFAVRGRTEQRVWEFEAADEAEVRQLLKDAENHPNVRGFDLKSITLADGVKEDRNG